MKTSEIQGDEKNFGFAASVPDTPVDMSFLSRINAAMQKDMPRFENIL